MPEALTVTNCRSTADLADLDRLGEFIEIPARYVTVAGLDDGLEEHIGRQAFLIPEVSAVQPRTRLSGPELVDADARTHGWRCVQEH